MSQADDIFKVDQKTAAQVVGRTAIYLRNHSCSRSESGDYDLREVVQFAIDRVAMNDRPTEERKLQAQIGVLRERIKRLRRIEDKKHPSRDGVRVPLISLVDRLEQLADRFEAMDSVTGRDAQSALNDAVIQFRNDLKAGEHQ